MREERAQVGLEKVEMELSDNRGSRPCTFPLLPRPRAGTTRRCPGATRPSHSLSSPTLPHFAVFVGDTEKLSRSQTCALCVTARVRMRAYARCSLLSRGILVCITPRQLRGPSLRRSCPGATLKVACIALSWRTGFCRGRGAFWRELA